MTKTKSRIAIYCLCIFGNLTICFAFACSFLLIDIVTGQSQTAPMVQAQVLAPTLVDTTGAIMEFVKWVCGIFGVLITMGVAASIKMVMNQTRFQATIATQFEAHQTRITELKELADEVHERLERNANEGDLHTREQLVMVTTGIKTEISSLITSMKEHKDSPHWRKENYDYFMKSTEFQNEIMQAQFKRSITLETQLSELLAEVRGKKIPLESQNLPIAPSGPRIQTTFDPDKTEV